MRNFVSHAVEQEKAENNFQDNGGVPEGRRRSSLQGAEVGQAFSIVLTKNGLHTGTLSGRVLVSSSLL